MITAKEARELSGDEVDNHLKFLEKKIREAIALSQHYVIIKEEPYSNWISTSCYGAELTAKKILIENGFEISLHRKPAQNPALLISW